MPHNIIEYSPSVEKHINTIMNAVHQGTAASGLFKDNDIKTRAISYSHYNLGPESDSFIHVCCKILSGRNAEQKTALSHFILKELTELKLSNISLTVEIVDIDSASYAKRVIC